MLTEDTEGPSPWVIAHPALLGTLLFGPFILALLCYIWAFCSQSHKLASFREFLALTCKRRTSELRGAQNIYYSAFMLLVFDGLTVIFGLVWGILMFYGDFSVVSIIFFNIWLAMRFLDQSQHLITALVSIIFVCRPKWGEGLRAISKGLNLIPFILIILTFRVNDGILIGVDVYNFLLMLGIVVSCCLPPKSSVAHQRKPIGLLSVSLFFLVCLPNMVLNCLLVSSDSYYTRAVDVLLITNFYIIMSGLLFFLVLKIEEEDRQDPQYECAIRPA